MRMQIKPSRRNTADINNAIVIPLSIMAAVVFNRGVSAKTTARMVGMPIKSAAV